MEDAIRRGDAERVKLLLADQQDMDGLLDLAIRWGNLDVLRILRDAGAQINPTLYGKKTFSPICHLTSKNGCDDIFRWIVTNEVVPRDAFRNEDCDGWTVFDLALFYGKWRTAKMLFLECGAKPSQNLIGIADDDGNFTQRGNPFHLAIFRSIPVEMMRWLFEMDIIRDANVKNCNGDTLLDTAIAHCELDIAKYLFSQHRAKHTPKLYNGGIWGPAQVAICNKKDGIATIQWIYQVGILQNLNIQDQHGKTLLDIANVRSPSQTAMWLYSTQHVWFREWRRDCPVVQKHVAYLRHMARGHRASPLSRLPPELMDHIVDLVIGEK